MTQTNTVPDNNTAAIVFTNPYPNASVPAGVATGLAVSQWSLTNEANKAADAAAHGQSNDRQWVVNGGYGFAPVNAMGSSTT